MKTTPSNAADIIEACIKAKLVPMMSGSPGIGKSQIVAGIAEKYNLKLIDLRLSQCDPTDLLGFPNIAGGRGSYAPMETFPIEGDEPPKDCSGWLLFLDEFSSATPAVQAASYKIVLDRMVGLHKLHPKVAIVCAGNKIEDSAVVEEMSTALQSRLVHFELEVNNREWIDWAIEHKIDHRIIDYLNFQPKSLYTFSPDHSDNTYACPRTWEFANRFMGYMNDASMAMPLLAGTVSEGVAREFIGFCKVYNELPKMHDIEKDPENVVLPDDLSALYALTGSIAEHIKEPTFGSYLTYVRRMPPEFQVLTLRQALKKCPEIRSDANFLKWRKESAQEFFGSGD